MTTHNHPGQPRIDFHIIRDPRSPEFEQFYTAYTDAFPIEAERSSRETLERKVLDPVQVHDGSYKNSFIACAIVDGQVAGARVFDYVQGKIDGKTTPFGYGWFLFAKYRGMRIGRTTHDETLDILRKEALDHGYSNVDAMVNEINDPQRMTERDIETDSAVMDPNARLRFWKGLGYLASDPNEFHYKVPQVAADIEPFPGTMLCLRPIRRDFGNRISIRYLEDILWLLTWTSDAIPGSDIDGRRNPYTDKAYMDMKEQLESLKDDGKTHLDLVPPTMRELQ